MAATRRSGVVLLLSDTPMDVQGAVAGQDVARQEEYVQGIREKGRVMLKDAKSFFGDLTVMKVHPRIGS